MLGRIGFDIDNVIRDYYITVDRLFSKKGIVAKNDQTNNIIKRYNLNGNNLLDYYLDNFKSDEIEEIYLKAPVIGDTKYIIDSLKKYGFEIYLISAQRHNQNSIFCDLTTEYIKNNDIYFDKLVYVEKTGDKSTIINNFAINIFIDDYISVYVDILYNTQCTPILFKGFSMPNGAKQIFDSDINKLEAIGIPILSVDSHPDLLKFIDNGVLIIDNKNKNMKRSGLYL